VKYLSRAAKHISENELALYTSGDVSLWRRAAVRLHLSGCEECRAHVDEYRADQHALRSAADELPDGLNWDRMAREMTANIHLGLAAGECVATHERKPIRLSWRPAAVMAGLVVILAGAWWLNFPASDWLKIRNIATKGSATTGEDRLPLVEVSESGIELRANGGSMGVSGAGPGRPVAVSASMQGSARARYVDEDTAQVTITSVYTQ
jgi:hypothetical protein